MAFVHELRSVIKTLSLLGLKNMLWILKTLFLWQALSCPFFSRGSRSPGAQLLELVQSVMYFCRQGIYIWKGVSKLQVVIVFSAKKEKKCSPEALTAVPCHGGQSSTRKQWEHLPLSHSMLWWCAWSFKTAHRILNNFPKKQHYEKLFFFPLPMLASQNHENILLRVRDNYGWINFKCVGGNVTDTFFFLFSFFAELIWLDDTAGSLAFSSFW